MIVRNFPTTDLSFQCEIIFDSLRGPVLDFSLYESGAFAVWRVANFSFKTLKYSAIFVTRPLIAAIELFSYVLRMIPTFPVTVLNFQFDRVRDFPSLS